MELIIKKTIGKTVYPFTFTGSTLHEVVMESQKLSFPDVHTCGICGKDDLYLSAHVAEGYKYTEIRCNDCRAELTFGVRKDNPEVSYLRRDEKSGKYAWKKFQPETTASPAPAGPNTAPPVQEPPKQQAQPKHQTQPKHQAASPKLNNTAKTYRNTKQPADVKPSGKAINFATKLSTATTNEQLKALYAVIERDSVLKQSETDLKYLQTEYLRRYYLLRNPQATQPAG